MRISRDNLSLNLGDQIMVFAIVPVQQRQAKVIVTFVTGNLCMNQFGRGETLLGTRIILPRLQCLLVAERGSGQGSIGSFPLTQLHVLTGANGK